MILTPDGQRYLLMGEGVAQPNPYHLRFVLPALLGTSPTLWAFATWASLMAAAACTGVLAMQHGLGVEQALVAVLLWAGLPSTRFWFRAPVLVDAPMLASALGAACLWPIEPWAALAVALLGAGVAEKTPVWAALFAWEPILLAPLAVPLLRFALRRAPAYDPSDGGAKIARGLLPRWAAFRDPTLMLLPWGAALACLLAPSPWWAVAVGVASAQMLIAYDSVRLIQMAGPVVCIAAASVVPIEWALPVLAAHWCNPWAGDGL